MPETGGRAVVDRYAAAHRAQDWAALEGLLHPEYVEEWPQSGERIRGGGNVRAIFEHYPGGMTQTGMGSHRVSGEDGRWVAVAAGLGYSVARVTGGGDTFTLEGRATYPDGSTAHVVSVVQVRDGRIWRQTSYFAAPFEAPAWRAAWVERFESTP